MMAPSLLFDISGIDLNQVQFDSAAVEAVNPHRGDMRLLDGIIWATPDFSKVIAYKDARPDEFWVPGHIPGRPLFPGVLMIEAAAQTASFMAMQRLGPGKFLGFVGLDEVKFRGQVVPGDRLILLQQEIEFRPRRFICKAQGLVNGSLCFEGVITGMPI